VARKKTSTKKKRVVSRRPRTSKTTKHAKKKAAQHPPKISEDRLKQILAAHKKWLDSEGKEGKQANLQEAYLWKANLEEANLREANLQKADLWKANLQKADLSGANLQGAYLGQANLQEADFTRADLKGANLTEVKGLSEATLQNANLDEVTGLLGSEFARADVTGTKLPEDIRDFEVLQVVEETSKNARKIFLAMLLGCVYSWLTIATTTDVNLLTNSASSPLPIIGTEIPIAYFYWAAPFILIALYVYLHFYLQRLWKGLAGLPAIFPDGKSLDERAYPWLLNGLVRRHFERLKTGRPLMAHMEEWVTILLAWWVVPLTLLGFWLRYLPKHEVWGTAFHVTLLAASMWGAISFYNIAAATLSGERRQGYAHWAMWRIPYVATALLLVAIIAISNPQYSRTAAHFVEKDVSRKPANYWELLAEDRIKSVKGASLRWSDLRYANAYRVFLVNADLRDANLQQAFLAFANLQQANLGFADLQGADLINANLQQANLFQANLQWADFRGAKGVTASQIKQARNWELAFYSDDFLKKLGLPDNHNEAVKEKLAEMEKKKSATQP